MSYRKAFGGEPIRVGIVEFRIMLLLASKPYHAFTRRQIADAVSEETHPVTEEAVDGHVATLRDQLGGRKSEKRRKSRRKSDALLF